MSRRSKLNWAIRRMLDPRCVEVSNLTEQEEAKRPYRTDIINKLLSYSMRESTRYLEIGVRDPSRNFAHINAEKKISVDPGVEFAANPVDFPLTSDAFFEQLRAGKAEGAPDRYDVIFIDGLHTADQVYKDVHNAIEFLHDDGFVVLHDCNPPTEYHAREEQWYELTPAYDYWNGTTWKGYCRLRLDPKLSCACIDTDFGVGIVSKNPDLFPALKENINPFFDYSVFNDNRVAALNLINFDTLIERLDASYLKG